jgi:pimeloyl-ACP methyl ester carboxylesterase
MSAALPVTDPVAIRIHGDARLPTLVYLPGMHGDWTLVTRLRTALNDKVRFIELAYPPIAGWTIGTYATAVCHALHGRGIGEGWLLAESFSSQVAWKILELHERKETPFTPRGLILAGGFVRHPAIWAVRCLAAIQQLLPWPLYQGFVRLYVRWVRLRQRNTPEALPAINEFAARRTKADRAALAFRFRLIVAGDPRPVAARTTTPVYALSGFFDPIVPWPLVNRWLWRHCPGTRGTRVIWHATHHVLGSAPSECARQILHWIS